MKRLLVLILVLSGLGFAEESRSWFKVPWIYKWYDYYPHMRTREIPLPLLEERPKATAQLDSLIAVAMLHQKDIDWAVDSLKPTSGPVAALPDSTLREMIYYVYVVRLFSLKCPFEMERYPYDMIDNGTGTGEVGWVRFVSTSGEEIMFDNFCSVWWAPSDNDSMDIPRAMKMFERARDDYVFAGRSIHPVWGQPLTVSIIELYGKPSAYLRAPIEFDNIYPGTRRPDTLNIFIFADTSFEYIVSFTSSLCDPGEHDFEYFRGQLERISKRRP